MAPHLAPEELDPGAASEEAFSPGSAYVVELMGKPWDPLAHLPHRNPAMASELMTPMRISALVTTSVRAHAEALCGMCEKMQSPLSDHSVTTQ